MSFEKFTYPSIDVKLKKVRVRERGKKPQYLFYITTWVRVLSHNGLYYLVRVVRNSSALGFSDLAKSLEIEFKEFQRDVEMVKNYHSPTSYDKIDPNQEPELNRLEKFYDIRTTKKTN